MILVFFKITERWRDVESFDGLEGNEMESGRPKQHRLAGDCGALTGTDWGSSITSSTEQMDVEQDETLLELLLLELHTEPDLCCNWR